MKKELKFVVLAGLFFVPFIPFLVSGSLFFPFITTKAFAWRIIVEIIFVAWLALAVSDKGYRPRKSPILYALGIFLFVIGVANALGVNPGASFWSNYERMEGYITLLHLGAFFLVIGSVFNEELWKKWWNTSLLASALMVIYAIFQLSGAITINQGGARVDGTFGNAIYLAVYMLFHIFVALFYMARSWKNTGLRYLYGILIISQLVILYYTATRGAILGLLGGLIVFAVLNIRNKEQLFIRKASVSLLAGILILVGSFFLAKDSQFVRESSVLARFASLNLEEIKNQGRFFVWPMAVEGFKDRPILGWGQENFGYVFQEHYKPQMYKLEPWFDRAHNIFLEWVIAGGVLGLAFYLSLYAVPLYLIWFGNRGFNSIEKSIITSLLTAYFFHNIFVFDHLISYVLFFSILAYIHFRAADHPLWSKEIGKDSLGGLALPLAVLSLFLVVYFANIKPIRANLALLKGMRYMEVEENPSASADSYRKAYKLASLGRQDTVERIASDAVRILSSDKMAMEDKNDFYSFVISAIRSADKNTQKTARHQLISGSLLTIFGRTEEAIAYLSRAKEIMPGKLNIHFELGAAHINAGNFAEALEEFRKAYEMAPEYQEARIIYLIGAIYASDTTIETKMLSQIEEKAFVFDERILAAYYQNNNLAKVRQIIERRKILDTLKAE